MRVLYLNIQKETKNKMKYKYRFKTEEEFEEEFGEDWYDMMGYHWNESMDVLFGKILQPEYVEDYERDFKVKILIDCDFWTITSEMVVKEMLDGNDDLSDITINQSGINPNLLKDDETYPRLSMNT